VATSALCITEHWRTRTKYAGQKVSNLTAAQKGKNGQKSTHTATPKILLSTRKAQKLQLLNRLLLCFLMFLSPPSAQPVKCEHCSIRFPSSIFSNPPMHYKLSKHCHKFPQHSHLQHLPRAEAAHTTNHVCGQSSNLSVFAFLPQKYIRLDIGGLSVCPAEYKKHKSHWDRIPKVLL